jgi:hypothetical protein
MVIKAFMIRNDSTNRCIRSFTLEKSIVLGIKMSLLVICTRVVYKILEFLTQPGSIGILYVPLTKVVMVANSFFLILLRSLQYANW